MPWTAALGVISIGASIGGSIFGARSQRRADRARQQGQAVLADMQWELAQREIADARAGLAELAIDRRFEDIRLRRQEATQIAQLQNQAVAFGSSSFVAGAIEAARGQFAEAREQINLQRRQHDRAQLRQLARQREAAWIERESTRTGIAVANVQSRAQQQQTIAGGIIGGVNMLAGSPGLQQGLQQGITSGISFLGGLFSPRDPMGIH